MDLLSALAQQAFELLLRRADILWRPGFEHPVRLGMETRPLRSQLPGFPPLIGPWTRHLLSW